MELATETKPNPSARALPASPRPARDGGHGPHLLLTLAQRAALQASICDLRAGADAARDRALRHHRAAGDAVSRSVAEATHRVFVALG
ncbi:MAG: hypothetical protein KC620_00865, partial [Myxococcales bacterium]|nr:hypothetical protein [Myxococcales bacterium]